MIIKSPIIKNGDLQLDEITGDLVIDYDIVTQLTTTLTGYHSIVSNTLISTLHNHIQGIPQNGFQPQIIAQDIEKSYQPLISANLINGLSINVKQLSVNYLSINISCNDIEGNPQNLTWSNG